MQLCFGYYCDKILLNNEQNNLIFLGYMSDIITSLVDTAE